MRPRPAADGRQDPLVARASFADPAYTAFVRAVRGLPQQQAEAYLLHHGERLNERLLGVAMDCSAAAAANHLQAATDALTAMSGGDLGRCTAILVKAYAALAPDPSEATVVVRPSVKRARLRQTAAWHRPGDHRARPDRPARGPGLGRLALAAPHPTALATAAPNLKSRSESQI